MFTLDDMQLHHTLYNTGASALVRLELKHQGVGCAFIAAGLYPYIGGACTPVCDICNGNADLMPVLPLVEYA